EAGNIFMAPWPDSDIITALGVLDWLNDEETEVLVTRLEGKKFILSYSEQDNSIAEILHRFYLVYPTFLTSKDVRTRHHRRSEIDALLKRHDHHNLTYLKNRATRFGTLVHNLA